jgi:signal transduction histidine kinase/CheY-like chemotaxis protein
VLLFLLVALDVIFLYASQLALRSDDSLSAAMTAYLWIFTFATLGILVDRYHPVIGRWFAFAGAGLTVFVISREMNIPELLILLPLTIGWMGAMSDLPSVALATLIETVSVLALRYGFSAIPPGPATGISLIGCWCMLGVLAAIFIPMNQLALWTDAHFAASEQLLNEARDRKVEQEQALDGLANANRQLALANQKMAVLSSIAEDAQKAKSTFVANVSHEFRTPLNMIIGLIDLMIRNPENYDVVLSPKMREDFMVIYRNCEHLSNMVSDVLDLTRVETGRLVLYREWVDMREIIDKGTTVVKPLLESKHLQITIEIPDDFPKIFCDRVRIQQVILNLLSNAARFTEQGSIHLTITYNDQQMLMSVCDTGTGIALEDRERIFEPFWQGHDPIWQKKGGSGIGLSLSREFVHMHGGHMWFESQTNQGTSFYFTLPITPLAEPAVKPGSMIKADWVWKEKSFLSAQVCTTSDMIKPRVVIYDESNTLFPRFRHYSDKVEFVNINNIDQMTGEGTAKALIVNAPSFEQVWPMVQAAASTPTPTTVIGCSVPGEFRHALETGATGYLIKPIKIEDIQRVLSSIDPSPKNVMIIDDDLDVLNLYERMLKTCDSRIAVRTFSAGSQALRVIEQDPPDLLFLDVVMPDMNGWQVLEAISRLKIDRAFPIYFVTAQDPVDQLVSGYILATIKGGVPLGKLLNLSLEIASTLMESEREPDPKPEQIPEDGWALK